MSFAEFISACEQAEDIHISHVILTGREKRLGEYRQEPYPENGLRLLFSMTKSFASLAVGIAWDRGFWGWTTGSRIGFGKNCRRVLTPICEKSRCATCFP